MARKVLAVGDIHFPVVCKPALRKVLQAVKREQPDVVVQIGDLYDRYAASKFARSLNHWTPQKEDELARVMAEKFWADVQAAAPKASCYQIMGNHDVRPAKRVLEKAPELEHMITDYIHEHYVFDGVGTVFDARDELVIDGVIYIHGYRSGGGAHMRWNLENVVCGHTHKGGTWFMPMKGKVLWELNCGYLADRFHPCLGYTPQKRMTHWTLGYGIVDSHGPRFIHLDEGRG